MLIEDEEPNPAATLKFAYLYASSFMENVLLDVSSYWTV